MRVLVLNAGSSTLKASLVSHGRAVGDPVNVNWPAGTEGSAQVVRKVLNRLPDTPDAVGYRVVHGGTAYRSPARVDDVLLAAIEALDALAPLHNRRAAAVMRAGMAALPDQPHVACFDTTFHADLPEAAWRYPLPRDWVERWGIRRFGFHGLSVAWSVRRAAELLGRQIGELRFVVAHLGSGCSVTAVDGGHSVDTSMGFTPYEGLMMGTRAGSVDPGIVLHLLRDGMATEDLAEGLSQRSGLLGVSGTTPSARGLQERARTGDARAQLALDMFAARTAAGIAAVATAVSGLDALVFTGGIGEHSSLLRQEIVRRLGVLGMPGELATPQADGIAAVGPPAVLVVEAREDLVAADEIVNLLAG
jgi:acetate kinase